MVQESKKNEKSLEQYLYKLVKKHEIYDPNKILLREKQIMLKKSKYIIKIFSIDQD